ncbi:MAG: class I SAM-dependent methyltransferase [Acidimicrobiales bacterium]
MKATVEFFMSQQYWEGAPSSPSAPRAVPLLLPDVRFDLLSDAGVFAAGGVDPGTKLLLLDGPRPDPSETGALLDLGCGYGPIALTLAARASQATVWAVDVNERARQLCAANAASAALPNVRVAAPEEVPTDVDFAGIWSNPPIRIGKQALHELLVRWLGRLAPGAAAVLVVQKHLGADSLQRWLVADGWQAQRLRSRAGYRLLEVSR